jgi:signal transduction histidine kinase
VPRRAGGCDGTQGVRGTKSGGSTIGTVNDELKMRDVEVTPLNDDLTNVLNSVEIPIVILGRDLRIRRFTPAASKLFHLNANHVGRRMSDFPPLVPASALQMMIAGVIPRPTTVEHEVQDADGRWYQVNLLPYVTLDDRIDGAVITAVDIDAMKKGEPLLGEARTYAEGIVDKEVRAYQDRLRQMAFDTALTEDRERRRIATQVHDHIGQSLALAQIKLTSIREAIGAPGRATFDEAVELLEQSIVDTRTLIFDLSPPVLYDLGLREALSWLVEEFEKRHGIVIEVTDDGMDKRLDDATAGLVFRAVRELLTNVLKHAKADSARVSLRRAGDHIDIEVEDKGTGFDAKALGARSSGGGFGLFSVREQISRLGGTVEVISTPGRGTRVNMRVPLNTDESPTPVDVAAH